MSINIARVVYEINRGYCESMGTPTPPPWDEAPESQKAAIESLVVLCLENINDQESAIIAVDHERAMLNAVSESYLMPASIFIHAVRALSQLIILPHNVGHPRDVTPNSCSVWVPCVNCNEIMLFSSKHGPAGVDHSLESAPSIVIGELIGQQQKCNKCGRTTKILGKAMAFGVLV